MHSKNIWLLLAVILLASFPSHAQSNQARPLITQRVDESKLTVLKGNTHPLARAEFDRGAAPSDLPMDRMLLVLKRSPEQEGALEKLLVEQADKSSPNYHKWLTPAQVGQQFGASDSDIAVITAWLESHGFQIGSVASARNIVEFSGNAAQVEEAFHTPIHKYVVNGEEHWANTSDPQIPAALAPVVVGIKSLHNFLSRPLYHSKGAYVKSKDTGEVKPDFTFNNSANACSFTTFTCYALGPYDFATIYNVLPLWNAGSSIDGSGQDIAIVGRTSVNIADMRNFRIFVGLPAKDPNIIVNGTAPAVDQGDEGESDLDMQWAGGVARNANIDFVTSANSNTTDGVDLSAQYIVEKNLAPVIGYSYGLCEAEIGSANESFYVQMWQQASVQGITVLVATGDTGASVCEDPSNSDPDPQPGKTGLAINGIASTAYNVAVGGTDFDDFDTWNTYWNTTNNSSTLESALGYIPEMAYNDSCSNFIFGEDGYSSNEETNCNNTTSLGGVITPFGGGGGASIYNAKPTWQTGLGVPANNTRFVPDVSMFAGDGTIVGSAYVVCQSDSNASCVSTAQGTSFARVGGTSASTQVFAGIMALVNQKAKGREGNANLVMYPLAAGAPTAPTCNSSSNPSSSCYFYDITAGTIAMPCVKGSPNCVVNNGADANGLLSGFNAGVGYDEATGLGSVNANNFVLASAWTGGINPASDFTLTSTTNPPTVTVSTQGGTGSLSLTLTSVGSYAGTINLTPSLCSGLPSESTCSFSVSSVTLTSGSSSSFMLTVNTTAPSLVMPSNKRMTPGVWQTMGALALSSLLGAFFLLLNTRKNRRWSTALALILFGLLISVSACGGGGGSSCGESCGGGGGNGGTPTGTTPIVVTLQDGAGTPTIHSIVFTLTVN